jgi:hypothetical protein
MQAGIADPATADGLEFLLGTGNPGKKPINPFH